MPTFAFAGSARVTMRTRAKGLLSALAHDLALSAPFAHGIAHEEGGLWRVEAAIAPTAIAVTGAIERGAAKPLSAWETREIERRIVDEVFGGLASIAIRATGTPRAPEVSVTAKREARAHVRIELRGARVDLTGTIGMRALGLAEVKAPLGAFTVADDVEIAAAIPLVAAG
jgi:hypothetical protein